MMTLRTYVKQNKALGKTGIASLQFSTTCILLLLGFTIFLFAIMSVHRRRSGRILRLLFRSTDSVFDRI